MFVFLLICSLNECYFAGKGTVLMLGSNERLQRGDGRRFSQISNELSASQTSIGSSSDIQQHLQSMFYLLRPEETLKMVRIYEPNHKRSSSELRGHSHSPGIKIEMGNAHKDLSITFSSPKSLFLSRTQNIFRRSLL